MLVQAWLASTLHVATIAAGGVAVADARGADAAGSAPDSGAADGVGSAVLDELALAGDASRDIEGVIRKAVLRGLRKQGARLLELPVGAGAGPCTDASCAASRARAAGAEFLVTGRVQVSQRSYEVTLELHDGKDGRILATRSASCPICSVPEVDAAAAEVGAALVAEFRRSDAQAVTITSEPEGALVYVDGALVGPAPVDHALAPGEHRVEVKREGYHDAARTITVGPDTRAEDLAFTLVPRRSAATVPMALGWTAVGLGAAALVTGVALLVVDERPFRGLCEGEYVDASGRCRFQYDTLAGGVAGVVVGAALLGGGAALLVIDRKRRGAGPRAGARVRVGVEPRGLVLTGRF